MKCHLVVVSPSLGYLPLDPDSLEIVFISSLLATRGYRLLKGSQNRRLHTAQAESYRLTLVIQNEEINWNHCKD